MRSIALLLLLCVFANAKATNYYFSSTSGDDSRTVAEAQNPSTPWKSISKLNSFFASLSPGDAVLFKRGDVFYGSITVNRSGNKPKPITLGAYGNGAKPVITGFTTITSWTNIGNGLYEATLTNPPTNSVNMVVVNDNLQPIGRYPKAGNGNGSYFFISNHNAFKIGNSISSQTIVSNDIATIPNFTGGELVQRTMQWVFDRSNVLSQTPTYVTTKPEVSPDHPTVTYESMNGHGFFFQNHVNALKTFGDWCYSQGSKKITMYFGAKNPNASVVKVATIDNLINIENQDYITIENLVLQGANENIISLTETTYCVIDNDDLQFAGINAIDVDRYKSFDTHHNELTNCEISNSNNNAANLVESRYWTISNNHIVNTGMNQGMGLSGDGQYVAIFKAGANSVIEYNEIEYTGYNAVWYTGNNTIVRYNHIHHYCMVKSDGGGIYSYGVSGTNRLIQKNIVHDGPGDLYGMGIDLSNPYTGQVHGIYNDGNTTGVTIIDNTSFNNAHSGLWLGSNGEITATGNTLFDNKVAQLKGDDGERSYSNIILDNNILFAKQKGSLVLSLNIKPTSLQQLTSNNNYLCRPIWEPSNVDGAQGYTQYPFSWDTYHDGGAVESNHSFYSAENWKKRMKKDLDSKKTNVTISTTNEVRFEYNATNSSKTIALNSTYVDLKNNTYTSVTLAPYSSIILIKTSSQGKSGQSINFPSIPSKTFADAPFALSATSTSGLPVAYRLVSGPAALNGNSVLFNDLGTVTIEATQAGDDNFNAATPVVQTFSVVKGGQTITFPSIGSKSLGTQSFGLNATSNSGLPVTYRVISGPAAINNNLVNLSGLGQVVVEASQQGNYYFNAATPVTQSFSIINTAQTPTCTATGTILREEWKNIGGTDIASIPLQSPPSNTNLLTELETQNTGNWMGTRIRGYICAPVSGSYTFYIAGDDYVELWLSSNNDPANKSRIAYHTSWTSFREWNKFPTQKSAPIYLQAGQSYYIEVLHKNGAGGDNVSVKWDLPDGSTETPIAGSHLSPFAATTTTTRSTQTINFPTIPGKTFGDPAFNLNATASSGLPITYRVLAGPASVSANTVTLTGSGTVTIEASQGGNSSFLQAEAVLQTFTVKAAVCSATGNILREQWNNIGGIEISNIPLQKAPNSTSLINVLETQNTGNWMGARIRGYICPPLTGTYTFYIAGDDYVELWLSSNNDPANKVKIAYHTYWTGFRDWTKYATQKSVGIYLQAGQPYYIEVLHKNGAGGDNVSVRWDLPNGTIEAPIPGSRLSPFTANTAQSVYTSVEQNGMNMSSDFGFKETVAPTASKISVFPNPIQTSATIQVNSIETTDATLDLFDIQGRVIRRLYKGNLEAGVPKNLPFNKDGLAGGVYTLRLTTKGKVLSQKIIIGN